mmetsp:Transcript_64912/g.115509  ORF Transcript_64912/g.115509 Transcript_64912/m.115509 type:complete len:314 (-) Transcript_64912:694-1635(-)
MHAATSSPEPCPMTTLGTSPASWRVMASAYSTANRAGSAYWGWRIRSMAGSEPPKVLGSRTESSGFGKIGSRSCAQRCRVSANLGLDWNTSASMSASKPPGPGNTNATFFGDARVAVAAAGALAWATTKWVLVPPNPKELTSATRPRPAWASAIRTGNVGKTTGNPSRSSMGFRDSRCRLGGAWPYWMARMALIIPATPAAPSRCPMVLFTAPSVRGCVRPGPKTCLSAVNSMGSPRAVPVPWHSMKLTSRGPRPASCNAAVITACWDGPFGAVSVAVRPSWLTADPFNVPYLARRVSVVCCSTTAPQPSPRT